MTRVEMGGKTFEVTTWSDAAWGAIPEADRPTDVTAAVGGWSRLTKVEQPESPPAPAEREYTARRPRPVWGDCFADETVVPRLDPLPGTLDAGFSMMGEKYTARFWSPEAWANLTDAERAGPAGKPNDDGWVMDLFRHGPSEKHKAEQAAFYAKLGYVQDENGRWDKPKPPDPVDDPAVLDRYREARRGVVIRAIRRWEVARRALAAVYDLPTPEVIANRGLSNAAANEVERDCRQLEALLGDAILRYAASEPHAGSPYPSSDDTHRTRPAAVRYRGVLYTCVADPTDQLNGDDLECYSSPPIVIRLEADRVASLD